MLKITPKNIQYNFLPLDFLMTWPDTNGLNVTASRDNNKIAFTLESAAVSVNDDVDAQAVRSELSKKEGMVPVNVAGVPDTDHVLVGHIFDHPSGDTFFMCLGSETKDPRVAFDIFTRQIWPPESETD